MALIKCTECGKEVSDKATNCPNCGAPIVSSSYNTIKVAPSNAESAGVKSLNVKPVKEPKKGSCLKTILITIGAFTVIGMIIGNSGKKESEQISAPSTSETSILENNEQDLENETMDTEISEDNTISEETIDTDNSIPAEYKSALNRATSYSEIMHMSKAGIYDQLTSEYGDKFTEDAAQYAIDNMTADWNENALAKAEDYSDSMYMSKAGIYDQLISEYGEKFTKEEATYAIEHIEADWNANALQKAKDYQENMDMSPEAIRDQLTSEYGEKFTKEEAAYAIEHLN